MGLNDDIGFGGSDSGGQLNADIGFGSGSSDSQSFESTIATGSGAFGRGQNRPVPLPDTSTARENPFDIFRDRRDQAIARLKNPPGFENTAIFTWGEGLQNVPQSTFDATGGVSENFLNGTGFKTVNDKKKTTDPNKDDNGVKEWSEQRRVEKVIKVASDEDPDTYIKVKVALASVIQTDKGVVVVKWIEPTSAPGAGASSNDEEE